MNKHIELVKKWLNDLDSVSQEELEDNAASAADYYAAYDDTVYYAVYYAAYYAAGYAAGYAADDYDAYRAAADATYWIRRYEELSK